ncbi:MAG: ribose-phosphate pyrophosphokinase [Candidatus Omnitrophica bacterium]|nr:ribose-phosphate pyrophosphokinase [Candidatus Omnitrophota bacterium]MCF7891766.1 ribose-phosphate pyrophosphokinase [Candidatus Omnitrophota bacterium]MCF7897233.1 ribose-phosphate pyrophosphokinase [Candidatus Omnitrophota bacterium]MCF7909421.1 ribose-phosphate pyrophosphokinase [Candidatus Omnitrophota bacterium]
MDKLVVFSGSSNRSLSEKICRKLDTELAKAKISRFSDGEVRIQLEENVRGKDVFLIQSTCPPVNENLMELLVMLDAARRASAQRITAVIPYFGYARQDRKDRPRVPITAKLAANILASSGANRVLTLDLHAGQIQGFFDIPLDHLYAINGFFEYFKQNKIEDLVIVSPDVGGIKMARAYAKRFGADLAIVDKRRKSPESTEVMHILGDVKDKNVLLVDDIIATGSSLVNGAAALKKEGAKNIFAAISHGILSNHAVDKIKDSRIDSLVITDSIPLPEEKKQEKIKVVSLDSLFADAIKRIHFEKSISVLFDTTGS